MTAASAPRQTASRADVVFGLAAVVAFGALVWLGRGLTFFADEWAVIADRPIGIDTFFRPFNEHWLGVTTLVHRALVETVGLHTYVPYLALLAALHVVAATEFYLLARRSTAPALALAMAVIVLFFGSGFENLFWGMQIGFVGAVALGLGATLLLDGTPGRDVPGRGRVVAATGLLTAAVMTSGFGLFMLAFVGLDVLLDPNRRRLALPLAVPAIVYGAWYLALGRSGIATHGDPFTIARVAEVPGFVVRGGGTAFGSALGLGPVLGIGALAVAAVLAVVGAVRGRASTRALAAILAIVVMYGLLGAVRSQLEVDATGYTRYAYLSGILALLAIAALVGHRPVPEPGPARTAAIAAVALAFTLSVVWNVTLLVQGRALFAERADLTRALVALGTADALPSGVDANVSLILVPSPNELRRIVATYGSPLADTMAADAVPPISPEAGAEALRRATNPPAGSQAGG